MQYFGAISKTTEWSWLISKANQQTVIQVCATTTDAKEDGVDKFYNTF